MPQQSVLKVTAVFAFQGYLTVMDHDTIHLGFSENERDTKIMPQFGAGMGCGQVAYEETLQEVSPVQ